MNMQKTSPLFSIIVPIYNVEKYLSACITSLCKQKYENYEIILVDDGSPDGSGAICDEFAKINSKIHVIHKKNGGRLSAWMAGLEAAQGQFIGSIDGDDFVDEDLLPNISNIISIYNDVDVVVYGYRSVKSEKDFGVKNLLGVEEGYYTKEQVHDQILPGLINKGSFELRSNVYLSRINKFIRKSLIIQNKEHYMCKIEYGEDNLWTIPNIITANAIYVMGNYYPYNYRLNAVSITHSIHRDLWDKFKKLNAFTIDILIKLHSQELIPQVYCDSVFHAAICINSIIEESSIIRDKKEQIQKILTDEYVVKGINLMNPKYCSYKEKLNLYLMNNKMYYTMIYIKKMQKWVVKLHDHHEK